MKPVNLPMLVLRSLALPLVLIAGSHPCLATELPEAPPAQSTPAVPASGTIAAFVTDTDDDAIPGARITLTITGDPVPHTAVSDATGRFTIAGLRPGHFILTIAADGFAATQTSGDLRLGAALELPDIALRAASTTSIQVTATPAEIAQAQVAEEEKQRVLGFVPNFYVSYEPNPIALTPRQKFSLATRTQIDPVNLALIGVIAGTQQAAHTYAWELGASGYGKRYAASYGTFLTGNYLTDAILPVVFKQDPRYFYKGTGTARSRTLYALANAVICKGDNHNWQPNYSAILGSLAASGISNFYYPKVNRAGATLTFEGAAIGTGFTAVANLIQEFALRKITPSVPHTHP